MSTSDESLEKTIEAIEESKTKKIYIKYFL